MIFLGGIFFLEFCFLEFFFKNFYFEETTIEKNVWAPSASLFTIFYMLTFFVLVDIFRWNFFFKNFYFEERTIEKKVRAPSVSSNMLVLYFFLTQRLKFFFEKSHDLKI